MTRILVTGGRDYDDFGAVETALSPYRPSFGVSPCTLVIHGGASGADSLADRWARQWVVPVRVFRADWERDGKAAGPLRNSRMIAQGKPDVVIAFPGGRGTADCVSKARAAGIPVVEVDSQRGRPSA